MPPRSRTPWVIAAFVVIPILVLGAVCVGGLSFLSSVMSEKGGTGTETQGVPFGGRTPEAWPSVAPSAEPSEEPSGAGGPRPSTYPVREDDDLARVCDGWYYPQSPKFAGPAPHQISVGVVSTVAARNRFMKSSVAVPELKESIWRAWLPEHPAKSQLVGCVDLIRTGGKLKSCKFDDPPDTVPMKQAFYRVRLYETATGRKLLDRQLTGEDEDCPSIVFLIGEHTIYSEVGDRQLYEQFRSYVMKK